MGMFAKGVAIGLIAFIVFMALIGIMDEIDLSMMHNCQFR